MELRIDIGAVERFEDAAGIGVFTLLQGGPEAWTVRRLRTLARAATQELEDGRLVDRVSDSDIEAWLARDLVGAFAEASRALSAALSPPAEADEHLGRGDDGGEGGESGGNSPPGGG